MQNEPIVARSPRAGVWALAPLFLLLALSACGSNSSGSGTRSAELDGPKDTVDLYRNNCISCHGAGLEGKMGQETNLQAVGSRRDKASIAKQISEGGSLMPGFGKRLTSAQIDALATWLSTRK